MNYYLLIPVLVLLVYAVWKIKHPKKNQVYVPVGRTKEEEERLQKKIFELRQRNHRVIISRVHKIYVPKKFDPTPNPNKYWKRFKRNGKLYYQKFYKNEKENV